MPKWVVGIMMWVSFVARQHVVQGFRVAVPSRYQPAALVVGSRLFASSHTDESFTPDTPAVQFTPWNRPAKTGPPRKRNNRRRFRQHVNPLAHEYQLPTPLSEAWPADVFNDMSRSLHLDIGCGKGGFLLELAAKQPGKNYLGVEIRPAVAEYAQERVAKRGLTGTLNFVGCNANVDLNRLLSRYKLAGGGSLDIVTIQFPDPHFKSQHVKRRVVTTSLVQTLAEFMPPDAVVFLQSDVQEVLDDMRLKFRDHELHFEDDVQNIEEYMPENYIGIPTERETSVIENKLPVYRTLFRRTAAIFHEV
jgi:tRNA (guanine-N7-)-methyltransferase